MNLSRLLPLLIGGVSLTACDPCSGVSSCGGTPALHIEGRLVDPESGAPVAHAQVTLKLQNGSVAATSTDQDGLFEATIGVDTTGRYVYELTVVPPVDSAFVARGLVCQVTDRPGNGCPLGRVVSRPYFADFAQVTYRDADGAVVPKAAVSFHRTGGGHIYGKGVRNDSVRTNGTDEFGNLVLFGFVAFATEVDSVIGDLTVKLPAPFDSSIVVGFVIRPRLAYPEPIPPYRVEVGPSLRSTFFFYRGGTSAPAPDVRVTFTRTGGVSIGATGLVATTDSTGKAVIHPRPLARGQVTGDLLVEPPPPAASFTITGMTLATHDDDKAPTVLSRDLNVSAPANRVGRR